MIKKDCWRFMKIFQTYFLVLIFFLVLNHLARGQDSSWVIVETMPVPVAGGQAVVVDSLIYILGGYVDPNSIQSSLSDLIQIYDPHQNTWGVVNVFMNSGRAGFAAGVYDNKIYYSGGVWELFGNPFAFGMEYWSLNSPPVFLNFNPEFARKNSTGLMHDNKFYLIGGQYPEGGDTLELSYIVEYDVSASAVTYREDSLYAGLDLPYHQMSTGVGDDIYIFGGSRLGISPRVFRFSTVDHSYVEVTGLNRERAGGVAVTNNDQEIYIIGGYNESPNETALDSVTIYHINSGINTVDTGPNLNVGRRELMAVKIENNIYVFGGVDQFGFVVPAVEKLDVSTAIGISPPPAPGDFALFHNYPNPFNSTTTISYRVGQPGRVRIDIYSVLGRHISTLVDEKKLPGIYEIQWNGLDTYGKPVSSSIYFYRLSAGNHISESKKMILAK